jgi:hypothetical protein
MTDVEEGSGANLSERSSATNGSPLFQVVSGNANDEELAALTVVVAARMAAAAATPPDSGPRRTAWAEPLRLVRPRLRHGPGQWRASRWLT